MPPDHVSLEVIFDRLEQLRTDFRGFEAKFVRSDVYELSRIENGRRVGEIEADLVALRKDFDANKDKTDQRFRAGVNLFIAGAISFVGGLGLLLVQVVSK